MDNHHDQQLGQVIREQATYHHAPEGLKTALRSELRKNAPATEPSKASWWSASWFKLLGGFATGAVTALLVVNVLMPAERQGIASEVVNGHIRSLMADHLSDVASSDQHTVKPWFSGKLDYAPQVQNHAAQGYPLVGGRLDYIRRPVAALVYRHDKHVINVFIWPASGSGEQQEIFNFKGFNAYGWAHDGMQYWAVSDLNAQELKTFVKLLLDQAH